MLGNVGEAVGRHQLAALKLLAVEPGDGMGRTSDHSICFFAGPCSTPFRIA